MKKFILNALTDSESRWISDCEISKNISQNVLTSLLFGDKINKPCEGDNFSHKNDGSLKTLITDNSIFEINTSILEQHLILNNQFTKSKRISV